MIKKKAADGPPSREVLDFNGAFVTRTGIGGGARRRVRADPEHDRRKRNAPIKKIASAHGACDEIPAIVASSRNES